MNKLLYIAPLLLILVGIYYFLPNPQSDWKTYTNTDYAFAVSYPEKFSLHVPIADTLPSETWNYFGRHSIDLAFLSISDNPDSEVIRESLLIASDGQLKAEGDYTFVAVDYSQGVPPPTVDKLNLNEEVTINGIIWLLASRDEIIDGVRRIQHVYHTYHGQWYEVQTILWVKPGADITKPERELNRMVESFKFI